MPKNTTHHVKVHEVRSLDFSAGGELSEMHQRASSTAARPVSILALVYHLAVHRDGHGTHPLYSFFALAFLPLLYEKCTKDRLTVNEEKMLCSPRDGGCPLFPFLQETQNEEMDVERAASSPKVTRHV